MHADPLEIDLSLVRRLVTEQFPAWADLSIERVDSAGTDNAIYRLGDELAIRLPYRAGEISRVDKEHRWLPVLAPRLPLPIPVPLANGAPSEGYPSNWSVCRWLPGQTAKLDHLADPCQTARDLVHFIHALQSIPPFGAVDEATWARGRGLALSVALVALPDYLETNSAVVRWARQIIDEVLADHAYG